MVVPAHYINSRLVAIDISSDLVPDVVEGHGPFKGLEFIGTEEADERAVMGDGDGPYAGPEDGFEVEVAVGEVGRSFCHSEEPWIMRESRSGRLGLGLVGLERSQWDMTATRAVQAPSPAAFGLRWSNEARKTGAVSFDCPSRLTSSFCSQEPSGLSWVMSGSGISFWKEIRG
ncbi:class I glutamine amidotransferase-likesuperfamily protein [Striga asiatica]|uniref:Class I glutamine amidotransferase-likesuperfamily protein n=1 Tax=Striga asiatica TaxID=4170 RepID=A0A5A7R2P4_STRAF|nr:class I glutamine amidotransferase-likesuperfamily protein [Striga asiatica]